jgi:RNA polymerase sigma-70 factor (ECF subfamily)
MAQSLPTANVNNVAGRPNTRLPAVPDPAVTTPHAGLDAASREWLRSLRAGAGGEQDAAVARLHDLLLRGARYEIQRRRAAYDNFGRSDHDDLAHQAADDALVAILAKLDTYRAASRFTTWAYKFVLLEVGVKLRRRAWHGREIPLEDDAIQRGLYGSSPAGAAEAADLLRAVSAAIESDLTPHQREVLVAVTLNDVPIDVLVDRLGSTRGAVYKSLHDARQKLRARLTAGGFALDWLEEDTR